MKYMYFYLTALFFIGINISCTTIKERFEKDSTAAPKSNSEDFWKKIKDSGKYKDSEYELKIDSILSSINKAEVERIKSGEYGLLPEPVRTNDNCNKSYTVITTHNETSYVLTVRYLGVESRMYIINPHGQTEIKLPNETYWVTASVPPEFNVINFAGEHDLKGCEYESTFYIVSE